MVLRKLKCVLIGVFRVTMYFLCMNHISAPGARALRKGRLSRPGHIYFITSVCKDRSPLFADDIAAGIAHCCLLDELTWPDARCLAWVIMPDHLHALIQLGVKEPLSLVVQRMKGLIAVKVNQQVGISKVFWQRGFHDHALAAHEDFSGFVRYIVDNPLRAGLVDNAADYAYWWLDDTYP